MRESRGGGVVGEVTGAVVAEEAVAAGGRVGRGVEVVAAHEVDVEISVAVRVEERAAGAETFGKSKRAAGAAVVRELDAPHR